MLCANLCAALLLFILENVAGQTSAAGKVCGQQPLMNRIIGGQDAQPGQWPWQVSIERNGVHICGGSLISSQWVVSAAQCIQRPVVISKYRVHLGAFQLSLPGSRDIYINVKNITVNSNYTYSSGSLGDISLLQLQSTVNFTDYILPICLPASSVQITSGTLCWVTGWGDIQLGEDLPDPKTLQEVQVPIIDQSVCSVLYLVGANSGIQNDMLCAGHLEGGKDSCSRDTGGPLVCQFAGSWLLAGIVSWGEDCALPRYPGVYTRASYYADWIAQHVKDLGFTVLTVTQEENLNLVSTTPNTTISKGASATTTTSKVISTAAATIQATTTITTTITTENSTSMMPQKQECGKPMSGTHTDNVEAVQTGEWPWQVNILANGIHVCGGTLISEKWVVSAAQCFLYFSLSTITVVLGTNQLYYSSPAPVTSRVSRIITNPMYSGGDRSVGDISLLELQTSIPYTDTIRPVCLPAAVQFPTGMKCWVTGWGNRHISLPTTYQQMLQEFELPLIDAHNCDAIYHMFTAVGRNVTIIPNTTICTRSKRGATNSCPGDSGGPLVCQLGNTWVLAGIASFSSGCALPNRPAVYTLVSAYTEWIVRHVPDALTNVVNIQVLPITEIVPTFPTGSGDSFTSSMVVILGIGLLYVVQA